MAPGRNLEYKIGETEINPDNLPYETSETEGHPNFLVQAQGNTITLYISSKQTDSEIIKQFSLDHTEIVGGGEVYTIEGKLSLDYTSKDYLAVPPEVREKFAELLLPLIKTQGIDIAAVECIDRNVPLNEFWKGQGFKLETELEY